MIIYFMLTSTGAVEICPESIPTQSASALINLGPQWVESGRSIGTIAVQ